MGPEVCGGAARDCTVSSIHPNVEFAVLEGTWSNTCLG